jgi:hypothetical protein
MIKRYELIYHTYRSGAGMQLAWFSKNANFKYSIISNNIEKNHDLMNSCF